LSDVGTFAASPKRLKPRIQDIDSEIRVVFIIKLNTNVENKRKREHIKGSLIFYIISFILRHSLKVKL
jgi:hypothetical protein